MKILKFILLNLATIFMLNSCQKIVMINFQNYVPYSYVVPQNQYGEYGIVFGNYNPATRASVESISGTGYDEFDLFAWNSNNDTIMNPYLVKATQPGVYRYDNIEDQELQYFKNVANNYEFIGIVPKNENAVIKNGVVKVPVESFVVDDNRVINSLSDNSPKEFLYTYKNVSKSDYSNPVKLVFNHGNAVVYLGFSSDRNDTEIIDYVPETPEIPSVPDKYDTVGIYLNINTSYSRNVVGSATNYSATNPVPQALIDTIKSYYSVNGGDPGDYDLKTLSGTATLRVVKPIPAEYKKSCYLYTTDVVMDFFDGFKWLRDNGCNVQPATSGGKPDVWNYILLDGYINNQAYTVRGLNFAHKDSVPQYDVEFIPGQEGVPGIPGLKGVRVFSAKIANEKYVHEGHTLNADALVSVNGLDWINYINVCDSIQYSLPVNTILNSTVVYSPTTFYAIPANNDITNFVIKLSYIYKGVTAYDVRVPVEIPNGLKEGKYYKYIIHITSTSNGNNDKDKAVDDKDDIEVIDNPAITVNVEFTDYGFGYEQTIII